MINSAEGQGILLMLPKSLTKNKAYAIMPQESKSSLRQLRHSLLAQHHFNQLTLTSNPEENIEKHQCLTKRPKRQRGEKGKK